MVSFKYFNYLLLSKNSINTYAKIESPIIDITLKGIP